jgi:hypothetical protein
LQNKWGSLPAQNANAPRTRTIPKFRNLGLASCPRNRMSSATKGESPRIGRSQLWRDQCLKALRQHLGQGVLGSRTSFHPRRRLRELYDGRRNRPDQYSQDFFCASLAMSFFTSRSFGTYRVPSGRPRSLSIAIPLSRKRF